MELTYRELPFPDESRIVYCLVFVRDGSATEIPFYVGQSTHHVGRLGDYVAANFSARTDFKVGVAARFLQRNGCRVVFKYAETPERCPMQRERIDKFSQDHCLLNELKNKKLSPIPDQAKREVEDFVKQRILKQDGPHP